MRLDEFVKTPDGALSTQDLRRFLLVGFDLLPFTVINSITIAEYITQTVTIAEYITQSITYEDSDI